ncbi:MAG: hypothetical protein ACTSPY_10140 [Candidatus Helarchaeota archaeon]
MEQEKETPLEFKKIDLIWMFTVDLIKPIKNLTESVKKISKYTLCKGSLNYYESVDRAKGLGNIEIYCENDEEKKECDELLNIYMKTDFMNLDEDYLESKSYIRYILKGIKIKFPFSDTFYQTDILLTVSNLGIGVFSFWVSIDEKLDSRTLANLQILPLSETRELSVILPIELLEELSILDKDFIPVYKKKIDQKKDTFKLKKTNFEEIIGFYWYTLVNRLYDLKFKSQLEVSSQLRCESYCVFPMVIIHSDTYQYAEDLIKENPRQLYQILSHMFSIDYNLIYSGALEEFLTPNITERRDIAYLDSLGSVVIIFGSETKKIIKRQMEFDKTITSIEMKYKMEVIEAFIIVEILQIQRQYLNLLTQILTRPVAEMSPREISIMRSYLSKALDMYHGNVTGNSLARKRMEHGKDIMEIDESFEMVSEKMELLGEALSSFNELRTSFFEIALGLILGIVPLFYIFSPFQDSILDSIFAISITIGIIIIFLFSSRWYWHHIKTRDIK